MVVERERGYTIPLEDDMSIGDDDNTTNNIIQPSENNIPGELDLNHTTHGSLTSNDQEIGSQYLQNNVIYYTQFSA